MTTHTSESTILIAEDEQSLADLYKAWLAPNYNVHSAYNGADALELMDETVDVVLLDRQMPQLSGEELIETLDNQEFNYRSAMITGVEPDFDILDIGCDEYLNKPVTQADVCTTVDRLLRLDTFDEQFQEFFALVSKKSVLETQKSANELAGNHKYEGLVQTIADSRERIEDTLATFDDDEFTNLFRDVETASKPRTDTTSTSLSSDSRD